MTKLSYIGSVDFLHVGAAYASVLVLVPRCDPTNIIMFLLVFCVTGAMAVDPQAQKNQWNVLTGVTMWTGKPQHEFRITWFHVLCGAIGATSGRGCQSYPTSRSLEACCICRR